jgi:hypothetical protein
VGVERSEAEAIYAQGREPVVGVLLALSARCPEAGRLSYMEPIPACQRRRTAAVSHRTQRTTTKMTGNDASVSAGARRKSSAVSRARNLLRWLKSLTRTYASKQKPIVVMTPLLNF